MKTSFLLFLTLFFSLQALVSATYLSPIKFSLEKCGYQVSRDWTKVTLAVSGGTQPYEFIFDEYPENWRYIRQDMYVPNYILQKNQRFPCKVRVYDGNKSQARATILFEVLEGKVSLSRILYAYDKVFDDSFYNFGKFKGKPVLISSGSYYNQDQNFDFSNTPYYTPTKDLDELKQKVDKLTSATVASNYDFYQESSGTGLDFIFSSNDIASAMTEKGALSLTKLFTLAQNPVAQKIVIPQVPSVPLVQSGDSFNIPITGSVAFPAGFEKKNPSNNNFVSLINVLNNPAAFSGNKNFLIPQSVQIPQGANFIDSSSDSAIPTTPTTTTASQPQVLDTFFVKPQSETKIIDSSIVKPSISPRISDPVFLKLPSSSQIDNMILTVDLFGLTKVIQDINKTSTYSCQQKVSYVNDILGRLQTAILMKIFSADQLQSLAASATVTYNNLISQINQKTNKINELNLSALKARLQKDLTTLEDLYSKYNNAGSSSSQLQAKIVELNKDIAIQKAKSDTDRQELIRQKLAYSEANDYVKNIQAQLNQAKAKKASIESLISKSNNIIKETEIHINLNQENITLLETDIKNLELKSDELKINYQNLQTSVQRFRAEIARGSKKQDQYLTDISTLEQRLKIEKKKLATQQLAKLKQMVGSLSKTLPTIESFVDSNYYQCFQAKNLTTVQNQSSNVYVISLTNFETYIESSYQIKPDWTKINIFGSEIRLYPINIMDSAWQAAFGLPYDIISYASALDFSFPNDFNCLSPSTLMSGFGVIVGIQNRVITIDNQQGGFQTLNLGCCTRIEATQFLPSIGQKIYWRGNPAAKAGEFNTYRATCV